MKIATSLFPGGRLQALTFSYDDGVNHDLRLMEIFRKYGIKATFNISYGWLSCGDGRREHSPGTWNLNPGDIARAYEGFEVAAHGWGHPDYELLSHCQTTIDILRGREALEALVGYPVRGMAYPYGSFRADGSTVEILRHCGIAYCRTVASTRRFTVPEELLLWHPTCHHDDPELFSLCDSFLNPDGERTPRLFYIWGHSFEFERNRNWERMEELCVRLSGRQNIWYATNLEICDYLQAAQRLVISCDGSMLFNPSALDVWIKADGIPVRVPAGALITLP